MQMPFHVLALLRTFLVVFAVVATTAAASAIEIKQVRSATGVTAWLVEDHTIPLIAMNFSFKGGAAADPDDKRGLAYVLSGMLDEGAGELDSKAFQARLEELAMRLSFDAEHDEFTGSLQTLSKNRDAAFDMVRLALTAPRFDEKPLERVRGQILLSLRRDGEDPETIAGAEWMRTMFRDHPYARRSKGSLDGVKAVASQDLKDLARHLFAREGLMIAVVGDIDEPTLSRLLDETFGGLPETSGMPSIPEAAIAKGPGVKVVDRDIPQSVIRFGHASIKRDDPDFLTAYIVNHILGSGGFGSRLMAEVREKRGLSYGVYTTLYPLDQGGLFFGGAATVNDRVSETIEVVRVELRRMAEKGPTKEELEAAKTYLTGSYALRFDSNRKIASQLLGIQRENLGIDYVEKRNDLVNAVTLEDVRRVARRIIDADGLIFTIVGRPKDVHSSGNQG
jgi:zinc protease